MHIYIYIYTYTHHIIINIIYKYSAPPSRTGPMRTIYIDRRIMTIITMMIIIIVITIVIIIAYDVISFNIIVLISI